MRVYLATVFIFIVSAVIASAASPTRANILNPCINGTHATIARAVVLYDVYHGKFVLSWHAPGITWTQFRMTAMPENGPTAHTKRVLIYSSTTGEASGQATITLPPSLWHASVLDTSYTVQIVWWDNTKSVACVIGQVLDGRYV